MSVPCSTLLLYLHAQRLQPLTKQSLGPLFAHAAANCNHACCHHLAWHTACHAAGVSTRLCIASTISHRHAACTSKQAIASSHIRHLRCACSTCSAHAPAHVTHTRATPRAPLQHALRCAPRTALLHLLLRHSSVHNIARRTYKCCALSCPFAHTVLRITRTRAAHAAPPQRGRPCAELAAPQAMCAS